MITQTYREYISFKRIGWMLKMLPSMLLSSYKRKVGLNFMKHFRTGARTIVRLRNLRLSGFGKFTTEDQPKI